MEFKCCLCVCVCVCVCVNYNLYYVGICFSSAFFLFNTFFCNYLFKITSYVKKVSLKLGTDVLTYPVLHDAPHKPCTFLEGGRTANELLYITTCQAHTLIKMLRRRYKCVFCRGLKYFFMVEGEH